MIYMCSAIFLVALMFYKVLIDKYTAGIFNLPFLGIVCVLFVLFFTKCNLCKKDVYVMVSFTIYILFIIIMAITDAEAVYVKRGVYEYGFYQMILFSAAFLIPYLSKERFIKATVLLGFPFVLVGIIAALTYSGNTAAPGLIPQSPLE